MRLIPYLVNPDVKNFLPTFRINVKAEQGQTVYSRIKCRTLFGDALFSNLAFQLILNDFFQAKDEAHGLGRRKFLNRSHPDDIVEKERNLLGVGFAH